LQFKFLQWRYEELTWSL